MPSAQLPIPCPFLFVEIQASDCVGSWKARELRCSPVPPQKPKERPHKQHTRRSGAKGQQGAQGTGPAGSRAGSADSGEPLPRSARQQPPKQNNTTSGAERRAAAARRGPRGGGAAWGAPSRFPRRHRTAWDAAWGRSLAAGRQSAAAGKGWMETPAEGPSAGAAAAPQGRHWPPAASSSRRSGQRFRRLRQGHVTAAHRELRPPRTRGAAAPPGDRAVRDGKTGQSRPRGASTAPALRRVHPVRSKSAPAAGQTANKRREAAGPCAVTGRGPRRCC